MLERDDLLFILESDDLLQRYVYEHHTAGNGHGQSLRIYIRSNLRPPYGAGRQAYLQVISAFKKS